MALVQTATGAYYGGREGKAALIRPNPDGTWRVKINDPRNRLAAHDGWVRLGDNYPSVAAAASATGVSCPPSTRNYRSIAPFCVSDS